MREFKTPFSKFDFENVAFRDALTVIAAGRRSVPTAIFVVAAGTFL